MLPPVARWTKAIVLCWNPSLYSEKQIAYTILITSSSSLPSERSCGCHDEWICCWSLIPLSFLNTVTSRTCICLGANSFIWMDVHDHVLGLYARGVVQYELLVWMSTYDIAARWMPRPPPCQPISLHKQLPESRMCWLLWIVDFFWGGGGAWWRGVWVE